MPEQDFNEEQSKRAFERMEPWLKALAPSEVTRVSLPLAESATLARALAREIAAPEVAQVLDSLSPELWDSAARTRLGDLSRATWYIHKEAEKGRVGLTTRKIPLKLAQEAAQLRRRMLALAEYQLGDHPQAGPEVAAIRAGVGYLDAAQDMARLANLYQHPDYAAIIASDSRNFRDTDAADALRLSEAILDELGAGAEATWGALEARAWTRLLADHEEVRRALNFLYHRRDPKGLGATPSLFQALRSRATQQAQG